MKKNRAKRVSHDKTRRILLSLVGILGIATILLGSAIGYKLLQKQSYEQKIEALKSEKDQQFNSGSQKDHFRKGQAEVITYYPLQGEEVIASVREKINQDIKERLEDKEDFFVDGLSRGMKQRLCLARALIHDPDLLILDEPTNGLDPVGIRDLRELIKSFPGQGMTVLVSSHILSEIRQMADHIGILSHGRLEYEGRVDQGADLEKLFLDIAERGRVR